MGCVLRISWWCGGGGGHFVVRGSPVGFVSCACMGCVLNISWRCCGGGGGHFVVRGVQLGAFNFACMGCVLNVFFRVVAAAVFVVVMLLGRTGGCVYCFPCMGCV